MEYKIIDWAYNRMFPNKTFKTFDHAIAFLDERFSEDEMQDLSLIHISEPTRPY